MLRLTSYNILIVVVACFGAYSYGFSYAVFGTSIGEPGFYIYFGLDPTSPTTASIIGAISALFCAGAAFGALIQGYTSDKYGRRPALVTGGIVSVVGTAIVAGSVNMPMLFVFRFITGLGVGQLLALVPLYITEVAPPHRRGMLSAFTGCSFSLGYISSAWIGYGTYFASDLTVQWRMPLCLCPLAPLVLIIGCWWIPESPRWLIWNDHLDQAWAVLQKVHHDPEDPHDLAAHAEYIQIQKQVAHDKETPATYIHMWTVPSWRKRTLLAILIMFSVQSTGIYAVTTYLILEAEAVGLTGSMPLLIYAVYVVIAVSVNFLNAAIIDRVGRRRLILIGIVWTGLSLLGVSLLQWKYNGTTNKGGNAAAILFIMLFGFGVGLFLDPTAFVLCAEIFPTTIRAKGLTISLFTYFVTTILYTAPAPTAFANIKWGFYLVFFGLDFVTFTLLYIYLPETKGLSLEEMGALFGDQVMTHFNTEQTGLVELDAMAEFEGKTVASEIETVVGVDEKATGVSTARAVS